MLTNVQSDEGVSPEEKASITVFRVDVLSRKEIKYNKGGDKTFTLMYYDKMLIQPLT